LCITGDSWLATYVPRSDEERRDVARVSTIIGPDTFARSRPLHVTGSAVIVHPPSRRVLLRWHERQQAWLQVGGHGDPGEDDPFAIARREAAEETGLEDLVAWPTDSILHVVVVPVPAGKGEPAHEHADVRYVLATAAPDSARPESDDAPMQWLSIENALGLTQEENLRESLRRVAELFAASDRR
jgi:8-oxo-dGTP pyrophosphatase MutT (NUDIX family)